MGRCIADPTEGGGEPTQGSTASTRRISSTFCIPRRRGLVLQRRTDDVEFLANALIDICAHGPPPRQGDVDAVRALYSERGQVPMLVTEGQVAVFIRVFFRRTSIERMAQFEIASFDTLRDGKMSQIREVIEHLRPGPRTRSNANVAILIPCWWS